jgi:PiT family inorganic phosphate transporter
MATTVLTPKAERPTSALEAKLAKSTPGRAGILTFILILIGGLAYIGDKLYSALSAVHSPTVFAFFLLGIALLIALGFEFVNGFLDTANAVATVIYTHSLEPHVAVVYSGILNFLGVLFSSGTVAFAIIGLLPVHLFLRISQGSGFSMVFAVLLAAIVWNLATWWRGLPVSSSHTMIGSILGVAITYQLMQSSNRASGLDWSQIKKVLEALLISPIVGFLFAGLVLIFFNFVARDPRLYKEPVGTAPPPFYIRALLVLTCGGVSYAHGSNDGQKGMGLIMLILVGTVPTAFALNHQITAQQTQAFAVVSTQVTGALNHYADPNTTVADPQPVLETFVATRHYDPSVMSALQQQVNLIHTETLTAGSLATIPTGLQATVRNQMYLASETLRLLPQASGAPAFSSADAATLATYKQDLDRSTRFIPTWVKVAVALALGLGTMVGWKRIVITVGEKIGKTHLTYAQGAAAQLVAMATILVADTYGLPVSTTHVLNSGIAGTMTANGSGLQWATIRNIAMAWILTLPVAALLSGGLFYLFNSFAH